MREPGLHIAGEPSRKSQPAEYITVTDSRTAVYDAMRQPSIQDTTQTDA